MIFKFLCRLIYFILMTPLVLFGTTVSVIEGFIWIFYPKISLSMAPLVWVADKIRTCKRMGLREGFGESE